MCAQTIHPHTPRYSDDYIQNCRGKKTIYEENCYTQLIHQLKRLRRHKFKRGPEDMVKKETTRMDLDNAKCMRNFSKIFIVLK